MKNENGLSILSDEQLARVAGGVIPFIFALRKQNGGVFGEETPTLTDGSLTGISSEPLSLGDRK